MGFEEFYNKLLTEADKTELVEKFRKTLTFKYDLEQFWISSNSWSTNLSLNIVKVKKENQNQGIGSKVMKELIEFAKENNMDISLTPTNEFGSGLKRLTDFYRSFGFVRNKNSIINDTYILKLRKE